MEAGRDLGGARGGTAGASGAGARPVDPRLGGGARGGFRMAGIESIIKALQSPESPEARSTRSALQAGERSPTRKAVGRDGAGGVDDGSPTGKDAERRLLEQAVEAGASLGLAAGRVSGLKRTRETPPWMQYLDVTFDKPVQIRSIGFKNHFTHAVTLKARVGAKGSWVTCLNQHQLMASPHHEDDAEDWHVLSGGALAFRLRDVSVLRLYLYQPSPAWSHLEPGLQDLSFFQTEDVRAVRRFLERMYRMRTATPAGEGALGWSPRREEKPPAAPFEPTLGCPEVERLTGCYLELFRALEHFRQSTAGVDKRGAASSSVSDAARVVADI